MKRLLILSGKGGTGKTTTAAALIQFAKAEAVADCDVDAPNLHLVSTQTVTPVVSEFLGGEKAVIDADKCIGCGKCREHCRFDAIKQDNGGWAVSEYACEGCGVCVFVCPQEAIKLYSDIAGEKRLYCENRVFTTATLKMGRGNSGKLVTEVKLDMLKHAPETELAIIDGAPGIGCPVMASVSGMDLVLVVAEPSMSGISDLKRLVQTAETFQTKLAVCVNKWDISASHTDMIREYCKSKDISFVGTIPYDKNASAAINSGRSLAEVDCPASDALKEIYINIRKLLFSSNTSNEKEK